MVFPSESQNKFNNYKTQLSRAEASVLCPFPGLWPVAAQYTQKSEIFCVFGPQPAIIPI